ncbi:MAG: sigma-70 family RNA polymerase sigma factor [Bacteroidota bacterium]
MQHPFNEIENRYLRGMMEGNSSVIEEIYVRLFPKIKKFILHNFGSEDDAKDTFQEALLAVYHNSVKPDFKLTCQFETYLQAIARNIWGKQLRSRDVKQAAMINYRFSASNVEEKVDLSLTDEMRHLYQKHFNDLSENAQNFLSLYLQGLDMKTIAKELGLGSVAYARKRKFQCKKQLMKRIKEDKAYQRLLAE